MFLENLWVEGIPSFETHSFRKIVWKISSFEKI